MVWMLWSTQSLPWHCSLVTDLTFFHLGPYKMNAYTIPELKIRPAESVARNAFQSKPHNHNIIQYIHNETLE